MLYDFRVEWSAFREYVVVERILFLRLAETIVDQSFMVGEDELGTDGFEAVLAFVGTMVKAKVG
jgi:hypothetical protein